MEDNKKKSTEKLPEWMQKTVDVGKKATSNVKKGIGNAIEKAKSEALRQKLKKLNPVFPSQYEDKNFNLPNMIMIVDDAVRSGKDAVVFEDNSNCKQPELKWFLHDENIKRLIEMRLSGEGALKSETLELSGVSSATMSQKNAYAIDSVIGKGSVSMSSQAEKEYHSKLLYHIEF